MASLVPLRRLVTRSRQRLLAAEAVFFDAYGRGGGRRADTLVIPIDYFARRDVSHALESWLADGSLLDTGTLEAAWAATRRQGQTADQFYRNLSHFLSLVRN